MAECPSCHSQVEIGPEYFGGLFTCPRCQAVYFITFDGTPEGVPAPNPSLPEQPQNSFEQIVANPEDQQNPVAPTYSGNYDPLSPVTDNTNLQSEPQENYQSFEPVQSQMSSDPASAISMNNESFSPTEFNAFNDFQAAGASSNPLQEIADFGNSEAVGTALTYRVLIKGLDIVQHIEELREILNDSKLGLSFDKLKSGVKNGQLLIERVEASQAAILAQRLRTLPVEMVWEQKIYE